MTSQTYTKQQLDLLLAGKADDTALPTLLEEQAAADAARYSPSLTTQQSWGATVVAIGDSITAGDGDPANGLPGNSWATYAALASEGRMHLAHNAGIGGNTSTQMLARFDTDVLAYNPSVVLIGTGTNDTTPATDTLPAVEAMIRKAKAAGCAVALVTPPPAGDPSHPLATATRTKLLQAHRVLLALGRKYGIRVVDQRSLLLDPSTGTYRAGASVDGTHPTPYTSRALGQNAWTVIADQFPPTPTYLADDPYDFTTLGGSSEDGSHGGALVNRALLPTNSPIDGTLTPSWPQGWDNYGAAATMTMSNDDPAIPGNVFTCQPTDTGAHYTGYAITTGYSVGDRIRVAFKFKVTGIDANGGELSIGLKTPDGAASNISTLTLRADVPNWATWVGEGTVSPGTTQLYFQFNTTGAGVSASVAQVTIDNLTTLGLA